MFQIIVFLTVYNSATKNIHQPSEFTKQRVIIINGGGKKFVKLLILVRWGAAV